jgi:4'-phosphopantetheinyl transferase
MRSIDSTQPSALSVSQIQIGSLSLAVCTPTPFLLTTANISRVRS